MMLEASENYVRKLIEENLRPDGRAFKQLREIKIQTGFIKKAEGSALVSLGNTQVLAGVKLDVGEPYPDTPQEGVLIVNAELLPLASPTFESGPPNEKSVELARVVDRGIRESKCIDLEQLCIVPKEKVWMVNVDLHILDHDGNLIDTAALAAISALLNAKMVKYEDGEVIREAAGALPLRDKPVAITTAKIGSKLLLDANLEEESALDARLTITTNNAGNICAVQKGGTGFFNSQEIEQALDMSIEKGKELRKLLG